MMEQRIVEKNTGHNGVTLPYLRTDSMDLTNNEQFVQSSSANETLRTVSGGSLHDRSISAFSNESRRESLSRISRRSSRGRGSYSLPRDLGIQILESISLSRELAGKILGEVDCSMVAQVGDSGDRTIASDLNDETGKCEIIPTDNVNNIENGFKSLHDDAIIVADAFPHQPFDAKMASLAYPLKEDCLFPVSADLMLQFTEKDKIQNMHATSEKDKRDILSPRLDYFSYLIHLAVFGILGIFTRYLLEKCFGPGLLALTNDGSPLYLDLPCNMLGSFLMGWFGIVFKSDLRHISEHLVIGITTGYMGSLTTFSGWNQKMLNLSAKGHWTFATAGIVLGMLIVNECVNIGVESAEWLRRRILRMRYEFHRLRLGTLKANVTSMMLMSSMWASLWCMSGALAIKELKDLSNGAVLWIGCLAGPPGVWARWYLARLNGRGIGHNGHFQWLPFGTLLANYLAACLMAALSTVIKAVNTRRCTIIVSGVQFGLLGCLSTVSTFAAEVYAMRQSGHPGRALSYSVLTILPSFVTGTIIYSIPVWSKHYT